MRIKQIPTDFGVHEQLSVQPGTTGAYAIYRVEKREVTTLQAQAQLAAALGYQRSALQFPGLKDRRSVATQYASVKGNPPPHIQGERWSATHAGRLDRPLYPTDIAGNRFTLTLRDLSAREAQQLPPRLLEMAQHGLPNYFDRQRFGSYSPQAGFLGAQILARDAEAALRAYLATPYPNDPAKVKRFKKVAAAHWGNWETLFAAAPRPSNFRSVLTYLRDHPAGFRKALNLIPRQLLSLYLSAYQSHLWNRIVGQYLETVLTQETQGFLWVEIAGTRLPVYRTLPAGLQNKLKKQAAVMPHHRAVYGEPKLAAAAQAVLQAEGLAMNDLKARILRQAYLSRHQRPLLLFPAGMAIMREPTSDERFPGRQKLVIEFTLPRGSYATWVIRCANVPMS